MPKHIRQDMRQRREQPTPLSEKVADWIQEKTGYNMTPKQSIIGFLIFVVIVVLALLAAHYFGYITIPGMEGKLQKLAPSAHLQYFFF
jgi:hypothetical protein